MEKHIVKNYPSPRLMETIGATNQSVAEAIGELVANCFDARVGTDKVEITVDLRNREIKVIDNGKGMTMDVLEKAVCIAEDMSKYIERGKGAKGHFGMGFKTSCSTLGRYYEIFTKSVSSDDEYHVGFNIDEYSTRPTGEDAWDVEIESYDSFFDSPLKGMEHGTAFVIKKLKDKKIMPGAVYEYLGDAFKGHIQTGDKIKLVDDNGENIIIPKKANIIKNTKIEISEKFEVEENGVTQLCEIKGWMALDSKTHNDGLYGFNIYRNNQLLEKWNKDWFSNHLMTSRIIGEVSMDFLESTFYKQGTQQSIKWLSASEHMKEYLKSIVKASREISKKGNVNKPSEVKRIVKTLNEDYETGMDVESLDKEYNDNDDTEISEKQKHITDKIKGFVKEEALILDEYGEIQISYLEKEGEYDYPFDYIFEEKYEDEDIAAELQVIVIKNHPLWDKKIDSGLKKSLVTSDAIYRVLVEKLGKDSSFALKIRNEWINKGVLEKTKEK